MPVQVSQQVIADEVPVSAPAPPIEVRPVVSRRDRQDFLQIPWSIYAGDPAWVAPLLRERAEFINPARHPFYRHGSAIQFVAYHLDRPVGRVQASEDPLYNATSAVKVGYFGMFESCRDPHVSAALLDAATGWLVARGCRILRGPIDYSMNYSCGLLVEGFSTPPRVLMNHNPPYYAELLEGYGLVKAMDLYSYWFTGDRDFIDRWKPRVHRLAARGKVTVRPFKLGDMRRELSRCKVIYNSAWQKNWGFAAMTDAEFDFLATHLKRWADPRMLLLAEVEGEAVGFSMTLPDLNEALRPLNGRLFSYGLPLGLWRFARQLKKIKTARLVTLGVLEGFRRRGVAELLILETMNYGANQLHVTGAELGWTLENNKLINHTIASVGGRRYKTYRIFEKPI